MTSVKQMHVNGMELHLPLTCKLLAELQFSHVWLRLNNSQYETGFTFYTCSIAYHLFDSLSMKLSRELQNSFTERKLLRV